MIIGIDKGASAVKLAAVDGDNVLFLKTLVGDERPLRDLYFEFLSENVLGEAQVEQIAVTGVGAEKAFFEGVTVPVTTVPEIMLALSLVITLYGAVFIATHMDELAPFVRRHLPAPRV